MRAIPAQVSSFQTLWMTDTSVIRERFTSVGRDLNKWSCRLLVAVEAKTDGYGRIAATSHATGVARSAPAKAGVEGPRRPRLVVRQGSMA